MNTAERMGCLEFAEAASTIAEENGVESVLVVALRPKGEDLGVERGLAIRGDLRAMMGALMHALALKVPSGELVPMLRQIASAIEMFGEQKAAALDSGSAAKGANFALCRTVQEMPVPLAPGATQEACSGCAAPVWVSPATHEQVPDAALICLRCLMLLNAPEKGGAPC